MKKIIDYLRTYKNNNSIDAQTDLLNSGLLNSLDIITLIAKIEEEFKISILGEDVIPENFQNIDVIAAMITRNGGQVDP